MTPYAEGVISVPPLRPCLAPAGGIAEVETLMRRLAAGRGPAGEMVHEHLDTGGKRLRARLALAALQALGGERSDGIPWAAACELLHNATLVHDDLQDGDRTRRGRPTVWARHGAAQAINAGDLLLMLPFLALAELGADGETRAALGLALARHAAATVRGQTDELLLARQPGVGWEEYRHAVVGKTCALFLLPVEGAALLSGAEQWKARETATGFEHLGLLFQLQDDVIDLWGSKGRLETGSDLREGKISALVVEHLRLHPGDRDWLHEVLALPRDATPEAEVRRATERFRCGGALGAVLQRIGREAEATAEHPAFGAAPALHALALELVEVALAPISHLFDEAAILAPGAR
jgi:geranylgeranyl diphosphate synthase type I